MREGNPFQSRRKSSVLRKKWFLPAVYIACVALVMVGAFWFEKAGNDSNKTKSANESSALKKSEQPAVEVNSSLEDFALPLKDSENVVVKKGFYDLNGSEDQQEAALVRYGDTYQPSTGVDYALKDNSSFDVLASLSGTVTRVDTDSLLGNVVEVELDKGLITHYSSLTGIKVAVGDHVKQGDVIGKASRSQINEDAGVHVHFEIRKDGVAVNPVDFLQKPLSALASYDISKDAASTENDETANESAADKQTSSSETSHQVPSDDSTENQPNQNQNE